MDSEHPRVVELLRQELGNDFERLSDQQLLKLTDGSLLRFRCCVRHFMETVIRELRICAGIPPRRGN